MTPQARLVQLRETIDSERSALLNHPVYDSIRRVESLCVFMEHHVFAVWDFMSLLMALRQEVCGKGVPWLPPRDSLSARLVNDIVLGEETDEDSQDGYASHFDLYHSAMRDAGANTDRVDGFIDAIRGGQSVANALRSVGVSDSIERFVLNTFEVIERGDVVEIASAFTFGREDLLPDVFREIVSRLNSDSEGSLAAFDYYLGRHIELDEDHHGPMAERLIMGLCEESEERWQTATDAAIATLRSRRMLWDGVLQEINGAPTGPPAPHLDTARLSVPQG